MVQRETAEATQQHKRDIERQDMWSVESRVVNCTTVMWFGKRFSLHRQRLSWQYWIKEEGNRWKFIGKVCECGKGHVVYKGFRESIWTRNSQLNSGFDISDRPVQHLMICAMPLHLLLALTCHAPGSWCPTLKRVLLPSAADHVTAHV